VVRKFYKVHPKYLLEKIDDRQNGSGVALRKREREREKVNWKWKENKKEKKDWKGERER